jgi:hypothetical protein
LNSILYDHRDGHIQSYTALQIERGDILHFQMHPAFKGKGIISCGDTIGVAKSYDVLQRLIQLKGSLSLARATLQMNLSGEKEPVVQQAEAELALAIENAAFNQTVQQRQDSLYSRGLISQEEYDLSKSSVKIAELQVSVARAYLNSVGTGEKLEAIQLVESQISSYENELRLLSERVKGLTIIAPIGGIITPFFSEDTVVTVCDTMMITILPIPYNHHRKVFPGQSVWVHIPGRDMKVEATVRRIDPHLQWLNQSQVFFAVAEVHQTVLSTPLNLAVLCTLTGQPMLLREHGIQWMKSLFL